LPATSSGTPSPGKPGLDTALHAGKDLAVSPKLYLKTELGYASFKAPVSLSGHSVSVRTSVKLCPKTGPDDGRYPLPFFP